MIAVDTSALMAVLMDEQQADSCIASLQSHDRLLISAGTVAEALIVAQGRHVGNEMEQLIAGSGFEIVNVESVTARRVAEAYRSWGKGFHPAGLNFGDCFAYEVANSHGCPLLYVGSDFAKTDVESAI